MNVEEFYGKGITTENCVTFTATFIENTVKALSDPHSDCHMTDVLLLSADSTVRHQLLLTCD